VRTALSQLPQVLLGALAILAVGQPACGWATPLVGNAQTVVRDVLGITEAVEKTIFVDSEVFQDEEIVTGPKSATRLIFKDGTNLEMGENSRLKLTKLVFDPDPAKSKVVVKAAVGVFRWTSGNLPHEAYGIGTPVATIGIRGTSLEIIISDTGLSTVALSRGAVVVSNLKGVSVDLKPGEATTILPPDADGNQEPPSPPGPLPPDLQAILWAMTVAIRNADPPSDVNPAGGTGSNGLSFTPTSDSNTPPDNTPPGYTPPFFPTSNFKPGLNPQNPGTGTTGTGTTGTGTTGTGTTGKGTTSSNTTGTGTSGSGTSGTGTSGTGTSGTGTSGTGTSGTGTSGTGTTGTGTSGTGTTGTGPSHVNLGQVTFAPTRAGKVSQVSFLMTFPRGQTIDLADALILNDPDGAFSITYPSGETPTAAVDKNGNPIEVLAVLATFAPSWDMTGEIDSVFEIPDGAVPTELFDLYLAGDVLPIPEPATVGGFVFGLACLLIGRRRRSARL